MGDSLGAGLSFHDLQMHQNLAGPFFGSGFLIAIHIDYAHVVGLHEPFGHKRGSAENQIRP